MTARVTRTFLGLLPSHEDCRMACSESDTHAGAHFVEGRIGVMHHSSDGRQQGLRRSISMKDTTSWNGSADPVAMALCAPGSLKQTARTGLDGGVHVELDMTHSSSPPHASATAQEIRHSISYPIGKQSTRKDATRNGAIVVRGRSSLPPRATPSGIQARWSWQMPAMPTRRATAFSSSEDSSSQPGR